MVDGKGPRGSKFQGPRLRHRRSSIEKNDLADLGIVDT
jgi:hypothetical protein